MKPRRNGAAGPSHTAVMNRLAALPLSLALLVVLPSVTEAYWQEECGGDPVGGWALPTKKPLDCALRKMGIEYATKILGGRGLPTIHKALNLDICNVTAPLEQAEADYTRADAIAALELSSEPLQLFVAAGASSDAEPLAAARDGSEAAPFVSIHHARDAIRAMPRPRPPIVVWLREGTHFLAEPLLLDEASGDAGESAASPVIYASHPTERAIVSGGVQLSKLTWKPHSGFSEQAAGPQLYKAQLPAGIDFSFIKGLFLVPSADETAAPPTVSAVGSRMTRARYPNCDDITGVNCYLLNTS